ncbi:arginine-tRNA-protein transferase [Mariannaea sp. PMI_226]|nr:arginine-tRNA-protein transferase [Mariannaea sp. PMI_226]
MYRPNPRSSCCPHYTIRLDSRRFKPSRSQRHTVNRFNKFVVGDAYVKEAARHHPKSHDQAKARDNSFDLIERVHEAEYTRLPRPPEPAHKFEVRLENNEFTEEKFAVYKNYQVVVHHDEPEEVTESGFKRFLCDSPLRPGHLVDPSGHIRLLGSYHQCYRLDGKLVAIGVLDLLPDCVSSVYFMYHESIHGFAPGKLGALHEISLAKELGYNWWYPGYYIHSCPKMKYKIDFSPQYILDPVSLEWNALDREMLDLLDKKPFVSLAEERRAASGANGKLTIHEQASGDISVDAVTNDSDKPEETRSDSSRSEEESLFGSGLPGITPLSEMMTLDMDHIKLIVRPAGPVFKTSDLIGWKRYRVDEAIGPRAAVAELVAAVGPDLMDQICLNFAAT